MIFTVSNIDQWKSFQIIRNRKKFEIWSWRARLQCFLRCFVGDARVNFNVLLSSGTTSNGCLKNLKVRRKSSILEAWRMLFPRWRRRVMTSKVGVINLKIQMVSFANVHNVISSPIQESNDNDNCDVYPLAQSLLASVSVFPWSDTFTTLEKKKAAAALCEGLLLVGSENCFHTQLIISKSNENILGGPGDQDLIQLEWFRQNSAGSIYKLPGVASTSVGRNVMQPRLSLVCLVAYIYMSSSYNPRLFWMKSPRDFWARTLFLKCASDHLPHTSNLCHQPDQSKESEISPLYSTQSTSFSYYTGVTGGFFQPSVDDIGKTITVKCISKLDKKKTATATYGPVVIGGLLRWCVGVMSSTVIEIWVHLLVMVACVCGVCMHLRCLCAFANPDLLSGCWFFWLWPFRHESASQGGESERRGKTGGRRDVRQVQRPRLVQLDGWLTVCLFGWLIDWLIDWLVGWLIDWLVGWLFGWLVD